MYNKHPKNNISHVIREETFKELCSSSSAPNCHIQKMMVIMNTKQHKDLLQTSTHVTSV